MGRNSGTWCNAKQCKNKGLEQSETKDKQKIVRQNKGLGLFCFTVSDFRIFRALYLLQYIFFSAPDLYSNDNHSHWRFAKALAK